MGTKAGIIGSVGSLCRTDQPEHIAGALDEYLAAALAIYSRDRPRHDVEDVTGLGTHYLTVPTAWVEQSSVIEMVSYPYTDEDSTILEADAYEIRHDDDGSGNPIEKVWFHGYSPATTETVRFWFTIPHTCSDTVCTIYQEDVAGFGFLVASVIEYARSSFFLGMKDVGLADLVDYGGKAAEARAVAQAHEGMYRKSLGLGESGTVAAAIAGDVDTEPQHGFASSMSYRRSRNR